MSPKHCPYTYGARMRCHPFHKPRESYLYLLHARLCPLLRSFWTVCGVPSLRARFFCEAFECGDWGFAQPGPLHSVYRLALFQQPSRRCCRYTKWPIRPWRWEGAVRRSTQTGRQSLCRGSPGRRKRQLVAQPRRENPWERRRPGRICSGSIHCHPESGALWKTERSCEFRVSASPWPDR